MTTEHDDPEWEVELTISATVRAPNSAAALKKLTNPLRGRLGLEPDEEGLDRLLTGGEADLDFRVHRVLPPDGSRA
jgi:hypothetical protein